MIAAVAESPMACRAQEGKFLSRVEIEAIIQSAA
jgi:hypothetical protein